jgi:hypothetical protein
VCFFSKAFSSGLDRCLDSDCKEFKDIKWCLRQPHVMLSVIHSIHLDNFTSHGGVMRNKLKGFGLA